MSPLRVLVVGGFEPSGHDAAADAIRDEGLARSAAVELFRWRDKVDLAQHPMFVSHRVAAAAGLPVIAGMLDEDWIGPALHADLGHLLPRDFDIYLSVHPWSTIICARELALRDDAHARLIDYHGEFSQFPIALHERVNLFLGGGDIRPLEPSIRRRCVATGVCVPRRFYDGVKAPGRSDTLVVSAGADGWAVTALAPAATYLIAHLSPSRTLLLAPTSEAAAAWRASAAQGEIIEGVTDIAPLLKTARYYLSKGGGTAVAEGLAAGCQSYVARSGIFWEDDALAWLALNGIAAFVSPGRAIAPIDEIAAAHERDRTRRAAASVWDAFASAPAAAPDNEDETLRCLIGSVTDAATENLPHTTEKLLARLQAWHAQLS